MDLKKVEKLIELMHKHKLAQLEFSDKQEKVVLVAGGSGAPALNVVPMHQHAPISASSHGAAPTPTTKGRMIKSPFVGTFYAAASPGSDPFVTVGKKVKKGDTLCIIEAMKLMNEIEADSDGIVREILSENGKPVEFDQALFVIE